MAKRSRYSRLVMALIPAIFIAVATIAVILYGRGYRPDFKNNQLKPTGLLSATSDPIGGQVYVNGELKTATNNTLNIDPDWYTVTISKEGYIAWQKKLRVQGEVVTRTDAFLFPTNPSLSPLTNTGVEQPHLSTDGTKLAYTIPLTTTNGVRINKAGLWVYELVERPLGLNRDPRQVGISDALFNFSEAELVWSPDSTQIMAITDRIVRLYNTNRTSDFQDVTLRYRAILAEWEDAKQTKELQKLSAFKKPVIDAITQSAKIIAFSPDETKLLYEASSSATIPLVLDPPLIGSNSTAETRSLEPGKLYVYDSREDKNYFVLDKSELPQQSSSPLPIPSSRPGGSPVPDLVETVPNMYWFPTSRHLVLSFEGKIDIMEYDRTNWITVYSGPFVDGFIAPWPNGSRIIIMTNLNPGVSTLPNLYTVNLR